MELVKLSIGLVLVAMTFLLFAAATYLAITCIDFVNEDKVSYIYRLCGAIFMLLLAKITLEIVNKISEELTEDAKKGN